MASNFTIRCASSALGDGDRILAFLDSQLPWLVQHGAEGQWGSVPFSNNEESLSKYRTKVKRSEITNQPWHREWIKVYVAELPGREQVQTARLPVAAMILSGCSPAYTHSVLPAQDENNPFLYVSLAVSDRSLGNLSKGSGETLLDAAKNVAADLGLKRVCLDCWNGNERRLVK